MQAGSAAQGLNRRLTVLVAIVVIAAVVTLLALAGAFASGAVEITSPNVAPNIDLSGKVANIH